MLQLATDFVRHGCRQSALALGMLACFAPTGAAAEVTGPLLVTQVPAERLEPATGGSSEVDAGRDYGQRARIVRVSPGEAPRVLTGGFHSACDPSISFDATHFLFAAKRSADDDWNIYESDIDGGQIRQITRDLGDCRSPCYQSTLFTLDSPEPWYQVAFVRSEPGVVDETGSAPTTSIYSCKLDGSEVRRLTFNLSSDTHPWMVWDGRLIFASRQRARLTRGQQGWMGLFGINLDGTDFALFACDQGAGQRFKHMPCTTPEGLVVFIEGDELPWDGAGGLSSVRLRRPLRSYQRLAEADEWLFHSPSPLGDGGILVSRRRADGRDAHGVYRFDLNSGEMQPVFDDPQFHDIQARLVTPHEEPDGRSSVVVEEDPRARLYGLDISVHDLSEREWLTPETAPRLRILQGVPPSAGAAAATSPGPPLALRRILGETPIEADGSFHIDVPANEPLELQLLDDQGMALRSCGWIWARNRENRGCIGCHEDGEWTSENRYVDALARPADVLSLTARRTVDFRHDVLPIIDSKCAGCHGQDGAAPRLDGGAAAEDSGLPAYETLLARDDGDGLQAYRYVHPGRARTSPLVWHLFGRNTARPWDGEAADGEAKPIPAHDGPPLTEAEKRAVVEWIDLGAARDSAAPGR